MDDNNKFGENVKSKTESNRVISSADVWGIAISKRIVPAIGNNFIWVLVVIIAVGAGIVNPLFWSSENLLNILNANAYLGCLVLGMSLVLITGNIDLSIESNLIFTSTVSARMMLEGPLVTVIGGGAFAKTLIVGGLGSPWQLALVAMLALSSLIGLINGILVVKFRMSAFMATLATMVGLLGFAIMVGQANWMRIVSPEFRYIGGATIGPVSAAVLFVLMVFVIAAVVLKRTVFGAHLYAVGGNRRAARAAGIDDDRVVMSAYVLCGFLSGLAAFILMGRLGAVGFGISADVLFPTIAAAVIGGVNLYGGRGGVGGMVGGLLLMGMITNILNIVAIPSEYVKVATALVILIAISIDAIRRRGQART